MRGNLAITLAFIVSLVGFPTASSQGNRKETAVVSLPTERTEIIPSPDGSWALVAGPTSKRTIILENRSNNKQILVKEYERSVQVGWSPDSRAFFVNDALGSNLEDAYIYWTDSKEPLLLSEAIRKADEEVVKLPADHAYFQVGRWLSSHEVLVEYCGHGGERTVQQFNFVYAVSFAGPHASKLRIRRVSRIVRSQNPSASDCHF